MKRKKWFAVICSILIVQFGAFYYVNQLLMPPVLPAVAPVPTAEAATSTQEVSIPDAAIDPLISPDRQHVAYITKDHQLVVDGLDGTAFQKPAANVTYKKWLDDSTLLYFDQTASLAAYIVQINENKSVLVDTWFGSKWKVVDTYFSPYVELLYIELTDYSGYDHVYRYDATTGVTELPLGSIRIQNIDYDSISDTMKIYDSMNGIWLYENNQLTRPDGSKVILNLQSPLNTGKNNEQNNTGNGQANMDGKGKNKFEIKGIHGK